MQAITENTIPFISIWRSTYCKRLENHNDNYNVKLAINILQRHVAMRKIVTLVTLLTKCFAALAINFILNLLHILFFLLQP